jgi:sugar phosphate permease
MAVAYIVVFFHRMAAGVVKDDLVQTFGISSATFANIGAAYFYAYMVMQIPAGILADTLGARKTVTYGTLLAGIGSVIFGLAPGVEYAFLGRTLVGLGVSVTFICILKILSEWFPPQRFGSMTGLTSLVGNLGSVMAQTPLALMVAAFTWRYTFISIGLVTLIVAIFCYVIIRDHPSELNTDKMQQSTEQKVKPETPSPWASVIQALKNWKTWPAVIIITGFMGSYICFSGTWGISYLTDIYGISKEGAANYTLVSTIGFMLGSFLIGVFSDRIHSRKKPMLIFGLLYLATWGILVFYNGGKPPLNILYPLLFTMGFCAGTYFLTFAAVKEVNHPQTAGTSTAVVNTGGFLGAAVLPALMGAYLDQAASTIPLVTVYQNSFMYPFIAVLISTVFILFVKETTCRNIWKSPNENN